MITGSLVIGIDPGVKSAVSLFHNGTFLAVEYVNPRNSLVWIDNVLKIHRIREKLTITVFIERPYLPLDDDVENAKRKLVGEKYKKRQNIQTLINQSQTIGRWRERLDESVIPITIREIYPNEWYCAVCRRPPSDKRPKRKEVSLFYAGAVLEQKITDHNLADALNIGLYGVGQVNIIKIKESAK